MTPSFLTLQTAKTQTPDWMARRRKVMVKSFPDTTYCSVSSGPESRLAPNKRSILIFQSWEERWKSPSPSRASRNRSDQC